VDEEKPKALPNLDYKIVVGNSLVSKFEDEIIEIDWKLINNSALKQSRPDLSQRISENAKNIHTAQYEFFHSLTDKNALKLKIRNHKIDLLETLIEIEKQILKEKGINPANASNKKQTVEITERKIKYEGFNRMLDKLNNLKKHPDKPLNYFDWQLDFPEVLNPAISNGNGNPKNSDEVQNANIQIQILNKQIVAINQYLKQQNINEHILTLQTNIVHSQIALIKVQLEQIEKKISQIYGELFKVEGNIVKEPSLSFVYSIRPINQGIKEINQKVEKINPKLQKENTNSELGFDIVIGNPPYYFKGRADLLYFFFHKAVEIGKNKSIHSLITTNYFVTATDADLLRKHLKEETTILKLLNFNELKLFPSALGQHNMITILRKGVNKNVPMKSLLYKAKGFSTPEIFNEIVHFNNSNTEYNECLQDDIYDGVNNYIRIVGKNGNNNNLENIFKSIEKNPQLDSICHVRQGLRTGVDKISNIHLEKFNFEGEKGEGVFILEEEELKKLNINKKDSLIKPLFKNSDIKKFATNEQTSQYLIYIDNITINKLENEHKFIYNHLKRYKELIKKIRVQNNEKFDNWFVLDRPREKWLFEGEKIVAPQRSKRNTFGYNNVDWFSSADVYFIKSKVKEIQLKYILSLLNSKLYYFWLINKGKMKGDMLELYQKPLSEIPIKKISKTAQAPFIKIVDEILEKKKTGIDTGDLERKIDEMVYELYELTEEEIKIVEGK